MEIHMTTTGWTLPLILRCERKMVLQCTDTALEAYQHVRLLDGFLLENGNNLQDYVNSLIQL
jgi:hypothetical protein